MEDSVGIIEENAYVIDDKTKETINDNSKWTGNRMQKRV
jgi:hypothetical protein